MNGGVLMCVLAGVLLQSPEELYRKDYAQFTEIQAVADPATQANRYLDFIVSRPDSQLVNSVVTGFNETLNKLTQAKSWMKIIEVSEKWLAVRPNDKGPVLFALNASQETENWQKVVQLGERAYEATPDNGIALSLALAYAQLKNSAKLVQFGEIAVKGLPIQQSWPIAYEIVTQSVLKKDYVKAAEYSELILKGFGAQRPEEAPVAQWNTTRVFLMETIGRDAYERRQYPQAIESYSNALRLNAKNDEAHYYIGQSYWKQRKLEEAMKAFAKSAVLERGHSARARQLLDEVFKAAYGARPVIAVDVDQYLERARRDLGLR